MKVICFGDSNTYGYDPRSFLGDRYGPADRWPDILAAETGWNVENRGLNGREIPGGPELFPADTGLLTVMLGTNDLLRGRSPAETAARMERFLAGLELEKGKTLLIAPPPLARGAWVMDRELAGNSAVLAGLYRTLSARLGIRFADAAGWGVTQTFDGVHFTEAGHRAFAAGLLRELAREI